MEEFSKIKLEGQLVFMEPISRARLKKVFEYKYVELDVTDVEAIDSEGIGMIVKLCSNVAQKKGKVRIVGVKNYIFDVMELCGLDKIADIHRDQS